MNEIFKPKTFTTIDKAYWKTQFSKDVKSGVIVGIVALPLAIVFAVVSGVSPEKGLITAIVAGLIAAFLGGSRVQISGPTGALAIIIATTLKDYGYEGLVISTVLAGLMLVAFGLLRLGTVIKFIPHPVVLGFTSGIAVSIFSTQIPEALGLNLDVQTLPSSFIDKWGAYIQQAFLSFQNPLEFNYWPIILTVATILILVYSKYISPKIPGSFIAIVVITLVTLIFKLPVNTIESSFGSLSTDINFSSEGLQLSKFPEYIQPAFTIAIMGAIVSLLSAVVTDGMIGSTHRSNTELMAQGISNIITPLFGGIPSTGAIARTITNVKNGGRTPVAGIVHALTLLIILLVLGSYTKLIPMPCLAGILIVVAYNMSEWRSFYAILKGSAYEIVILLSTFLLTVLVNLTVAIEIGMILAAFLFIQRMSKLSTVFSITSSGSEDAKADSMEDYSQIPKGIDIFEISGPFFFAAARQYQEVLQELGEKSKIVIIRMRHVPFIDSTGIKNFRMAVESMQKKKKAVILSGVRNEVLSDLTSGGMVDIIGKDHIFSHFDFALEFAKNELSKEIETETEQEISSK